MPLERDDRHRSLFFLAFCIGVTATLITGCVDDDDDPQGHEFNYGPQTITRYSSESGSFELYDRVSYTYYSDRRIETRTRFEYEAGGWIERNRDRYEYSGSSWTVTSYWFDEQEWSELDREVYALNDAGLVDTVTDFNFDSIDERWVESGLARFGYDGNGVESITHFDWVDDDWEQVGNTVYEYDDSGRLDTVTASEIWEGEESAERRFFEFDDEGRLARVLGQHREGDGDWQESYRVTCEYIEGHQVGSFGVEIMEGGDWREEEKTESTFDDQGRLIEQLSSEWDAGGWTVDGRHEFEHTEEGSPETWLLNPFIEAYPEELILEWGYGPGAFER